MPFYYAEVDPATLDQGFRYVVERAAKSAEIDLSLPPVSVVFIREVPGAAGALLVHDNQILGQATKTASRSDVPKIWLNVDQSDYMAGRTTAHECRHVYQFRDNGWWPLKLAELDANAYEMDKQGRAEGLSQVIRQLDCELQKNLAILG